MIKASAILLVLMLIVRYVPQLVIDLKNRNRRVQFSERTPIRAFYIFAAYIFIVVICAAHSLPESFHVTHAAGLITFSFGNLLGILGLWSLGGNYSEEILVYEKSKLVLDGVYSVIRHPMRVGVGLETLGIILFFDQWLLLSLWIFILVCQILRTKVEDSFLRRVYGEAAVRYQRNVPSINPLVRLAKNQSS